MASPNVALRGQNQVHKAFEGFYVLKEGSCCQMLLLKTKCNSNRESNGTIRFDLERSKSGSEFEWEDACT